MTLRSQAVLAFVVLLIVVPSSLYGDEARVGNAVAKLFDVGWDTSSKSAAQAKHWYELAEQYEPGDARIAYSYALVQIKHRKYKNGLLTIDRIIAADSKNIAATKAKIWLDVITKNYDSSLTGIEHLSDLLGELITEGGSSEEQQEVVGFLGRIIGFLEGPVKGAVSDTLISRYEGKIADHLTGSLETVFEEARRSLEQQFTALSQEKDEVAATSKIEAEKERAQTLVNLDKQSEDFVDQRKKLVTEGEKIQRESKSEIDKLAAENRPLGELLGQLESQIASVRSERFRAAAQASRLQSIFGSSEDPALRSSVLLEMNRVGLIARQYDIELNNLDRRGSELLRQRGEILRRVNFSRAKAYELLKENKRGFALLKKSEKKLKAEKKKAARPIRSISNRARNLATQAAAFTTYEPFPLEEEKNRMLELLGKG